MGTAREVAVAASVRRCRGGAGRAAAGLGRGRRRRAGLAGTRDALYLPDGTRLPWEEVEAADWDRDTEAVPGSRGRARWGEPRAEHALIVDRASRAGSSSWSASG